MAENRNFLSLSERTELKTRLGIRFGAILEMPENELTKLVYFLESDPLFQKFYRCENPDHKIFSRQRFPSSRMTNSFYEVDEGRVIRTESAPDVESVLIKHKTLLKQIQKIGQENFETYFLYDEDEKPSARIAAELGLSEEDVNEIRGLTDQVLLRSDMFHPSGMAPSETAMGAGLSYTKIASYVRKPGGGFEMEFYSPGMARGLYKVNYERLQNLKKAGALDSQEKRMLQEIIKWLELVNSRKNLIYRILSVLPQRQPEFFESGDWDELLPLTQKSFSIEMNVTPAAVCRAIQSRSVIVPNGEEIPLGDLFPSKKDIVKKKLLPLLRENTGLSDQKLRDLVQAQLGAALSRRSINVYRHEIGRSGKKKPISR